MHGKVLNISDADYHANSFDERPALSASMIRILCDESPLHAWTAHPKLNPNWRPGESTKEQDLGTLAHALMLQGIDKAHVMCAEYKGATVKDFRSGVAQEERDAARAAGKIPIFQERAAEVALMIARCKINLLNHRDASNAFTNGKPEQTLTWEEDGVLFKVRIDWLHDDRRFVDDYKTTGGSANPEQFGRQMFDRGHDIQSVLYKRAVSRVFNVDEPRFRFVVQEANEPFALSVIEPGGDLQMLGEKRIAYAVELWKQCLKTGEWPGYRPVTHVSKPVPPYIEEAWLTKEMEGVCR